MVINLSNGWDVIVNDEPSQQENEISVSSVEVIDDTENVIDISHLLRKMI